MTLYQSTERSPEETMSINWLSFNDRVIFIDPDRGLTYHGVVRKRDDGSPYVCCNVAMSTEKTATLNMNFPLKPDWQLDPSIFYSEENVRKLIELWGCKDMSQAVKTIIPEFSQFLKPGEESYSKGVAKMVKDAIGADSAKKRIIINILLKADKHITKGQDSKIHIYDLPAGHATRYTLEASAVFDDEWVIRDGNGYLVGADYDCFENAQQDLDILNDKGPVGLSHPLPQGFSTIEIPPGPWCVVQQQGWVTNPGWQGETEVEAIERFQRMNPDFCKEIDAGSELESSFVMTP